MHAAKHTGHTVPLGERLPLWSIIPFIGILLSIALWPMFAPHWWEHNLGKVSAFWALLFAVPFVIAFGLHDGLYAILHIYVLDYIPFVILLASLFIISGGVIVRGSIKATPVVNTVIIVIGTLLASWIGTTGASMLLIRPLLRANAHRRFKVHTPVFFIFLVSNIGGSLTPIGDPPLFLGFLHGVPFFWTFKLISLMSVNVVVLLLAYYLIDYILMKRETATQPESSEPLKVEGLFNLLLLGGVVVAVILSGVLAHNPLFWDATHQVNRGIRLMGGAHPLVLPWISLLRDGAMIALILISLKTTTRKIRKDNEFTYWPIQEVALLFAGIFMTIVPALEILKAGTAGALGFIIEAVGTPASYFWITGSLSSFLDNAPTYLTFFNTALGNYYPGVPETAAVPQLLANYPTILLSISAGAVFMGAMTYIGNAPNFMVRSIAMETGIRMPSFFGFMAWSATILLPLFLLDTWLLGVLY
ncbi:MAG: sodium:proton antiporter [Candidatus Delongbacteria bacterium]|nr:sodium:proton antiporter [Candidatus Delongbacteria bacterium]